MKSMKALIIVMVGAFTIWSTSVFAGNVVKILEDDEYVPKYEETRYSAKLMNFNYEGVVAGAGIAMPTDGNIGNFLIEDIELTMKDKKFTDGAIDTEELGEVRILFSASMASASVGFIALLTDEQLKILKILNKEDINMSTPGDGASIGAVNVESDLASNIVEDSSAPEAVSNDNSKNDGFLNGIKYGISYPLVFWGAEGFVKVPLNEMTGIFTFGYILTLICILLIVGSIFIFKK